MIKVAGPTERPRQAPGRGEGRVGENETLNHRGTGFRPLSVDISTL